MRWSSQADQSARSARHPPWFDPALPRREDCVLKAILDDRAARDDAKPAEAPQPAQPGRDPASGQS